MLKKLTISGSVQVSNDLYLNDIKIDEYIRKHHLVYSSPRRVKGQQGYLYEIEYGSYSYEDALLWDFERPNEPLSGGCSTFRNGDFVGRNFDWYFDKNVEFLVKSTNNGCYGVMGISTGMNITKADMDNRKDLGDLYRIIPFYLVDGINECGLVVSEHVVPHNPDFYLEEDKNTHNYGKNATSESPQIPSLFLPRFVLDHCKDLDEVLDYLEGSIITQAKYVVEHGYEVHYIIMGDKACTKAGYEGAKSLIVEFRNSKVVILPCIEKENGEWTTYPVLTNFHIGCPENDERNQIQFGPLQTSKGNKRLSTPADATDGHFASIENGIELMGQGVERYNLLIDKVKDIEISNSGVPEYKTMLAMTEIWYDKAYEGVSSLFDTEFTDGGALTVDTPTSGYDDIKGRAKIAWENAVRQEHSASQPWQTTHTTVYNIPERKIYLKAQNGAYQDVIDETPLIAVYSLEGVKKKYISPYFYDMVKAGTSICTCNFDGGNGEVYELLSGKYNFDDFKLGNDKECELKFSLGSEPTDIESINFPATWEWLDEGEFNNGYTYCVSIMRENGKYLATTKHKYQTKSL